MARGRSALSRRRLHEGRPGAPPWVSSVLEVLRRGPQHRAVQRFALVDDDNVPSLPRQGNWMVEEK